MTNQTTIKNRVEIIDALRGFALAGIVIAHFTENYLGGPTTEAFNTATHQTIFDSIADGFIFLIIRGKFFALFSFLFGWSFFTQMRSASEKNTSFQMRFLWRIIILLIIGYIHHLFYRGDILTVYAMTGIFLIPFYKVSSKWLLILSSFIFLGGIRYLIFIFFGSDPLFSNVNLAPDSPENIAYYTILKEGSLLDVFKTNAVEGFLMKLDFQFGIFYRGYLTFGFFLLGLLFGRIAFFEKLDTHKKILKKLLYGSIITLIAVILISVVGFILANAGNTDQNQQQNFQMDSWSAMAGLTLYDLLNISSTFIIICLFVIWWKKNRGQRFLLKLAPYGKMALTNYIFQTLIGTFILYGWGLGYIGTIPNSSMFLLSLLFIIIQCVLSNWWLKKFYYGPLEWLWRACTYFKWPPFKR